VKEENKMIRTQIQLTEEQYQAIKQLSLATQQSIAAIVRKALEQFLLTRKPGREALYHRAKSVVGKYRIRTHDISVEHDRYLKETYQK
jgi:hypothetical protein